MGRDWNWRCAGHPQTALAPCQTQKPLPWQTLGRNAGRPRRAYRARKRSFQERPHQLVRTIVLPAFVGVTVLGVQDADFFGAYILNMTGGNPALASVGTNVTQRPMTGKPLFGDRIAAKTGAAAAGEPARQAKYVSPISLSPPEKPTCRWSESRSRPRASFRSRH